MKAGGAVKKAANGGFLKDSKGKGYKGYPHSPTSESGDKVSAHKAGGGVKKRQFGGGGLGTPSGVIGSGTTPTGGGVTGLLAQSMPGRGATQPIQGPATLSGRPMIPALPGVVPQPRSAISLRQRPAPGTSVGFNKGGRVKTPVTNASGGGAGGEARLKKTSAAKSVPATTETGSPNPGSNPAPRGMKGASAYRQWGKGVT